MSAPDERSPDAAATDAASQQGAGPQDAASQHEDGAGDAAPQHDHSDANAASQHGGPAGPAASQQGGAAGAPASQQADPAAAGEAGARPREKPKVFLAVNLSLPTTRRLADEIAALRKPLADAGYDIRWVPAPNLHVTLKFLGWIPADAVDAIRGALRRPVAARRAFELEARGIGAFPSLTRPRVVWAGLAPQPALAALQKDVEEHLEKAGFPREERAFHPHVTLGRVSGSPAHRDDAPALLPSLVAEREGRVYGTGRVTELVVYESRTSKRGAEYHALHRIPLGG